MKDSEARAHSWTCPCCGGQLSHETKRRFCRHLRRKQDGSPCLYGRGQKDGE